MNEMKRIIAKANRDKRIMEKEAEAEMELMEAVMKVVAKKIYGIQYAIEKNKGMFKLDYDSHKSALVSVFNKAIDELNDIKDLEAHSGLKEHLNNIIYRLRIICKAIIDHLYTSKEELTSSFHKSVTTPFQEILEDLKLEEKAYSDILSWLRKEA